MKTRYTLALFLSCICAVAHPMGNFSVSHYAGFTVGPHGVELEYVLDLAEIPTFELLRDWKVQTTGPKADLERKAKEQAAVWLSNLAFTDGTANLKPVLERVTVAVADGAGNLPIMRITTRARIAEAAGTLRYEDRNYPDRAGWKEVVIRTSDGVVLSKASQGDHDISKALTAYPADPTLAPPQDLRAEINWTAPVPVPTVITRTVHAPVVIPQKSVIAAIPQPHTAPAAVSPALATKQSAPAGSVVRGDSLSMFLRQREFTPWMILVALVTAFVLGAAHALTPGHGKTIVAAYLVGSRGTLKHAAFLGAMVTFTHTIVVFALGLATLLLFQFIVPEKVIQALSVISGLSIVAMGAWVLRKRLKSRQSTTHHHHHHHDHDHHDHHHHDHDHHPHTHDHAHPHTHAHAHDHDHGHAHVHAHDHGHHHGPGGHTHMPDEISWGGLVALGASGGLVPCESAVVLLLGAIALGRVGLGLLLLIAFSLGLALVLMSIGVLVVYGKSLIPKFGGALPTRFVNAMPIASAAFVTLLGVIMTGVSLGLIHPRWMLG